MRYICAVLLSFYLAVLSTSCNHIEVSTKTESPNKATIFEKLKNFDSIPKTKVMVLGTYHFAQEDTDELSEENQKQLELVIKALNNFVPTKIVIEKEPEQAHTYQKAYEDFLNGAFEISDRPNEIFQLGFQLAKKAGHDSIYLFDNHPPFIGSLKDFSFQGFEAYAKSNDSGFYDRHLQTILDTYTYNDSLLKSLPIFERITTLNSPQIQAYNIQRMHMYEVRVGIGKTWIGADWVGRWYQRNIRMMGHLLKMAGPDERIICIVGDNHKWVLEQLIRNTPDLELVTTQTYLKFNHQ